MALLLVVTVIALLSAVIIRFNRSMQLALEESSRYQSRVRLESMAQSGMDIGMAVLLIDSRVTEYDSLLENWALLNQTVLDIGTDQGDVLVSITDLEGRFPIHSLVTLVTEGKNSGEGTQGLTPEKARDVLIRLLQSDLFVVESEAEAREIVDSLTDWFDTDDDESDNGAESSYYESLEKPVVIRNGPVDFLDELLQVKGVTWELLYGNDEKQALAEYVSVVNRSSKININTAPAALIQALDDRISSDYVATIDEYRRDEANVELLGDSSWFIDNLPGDIDGGELQDMVTTESSYFSVESEARYIERFLNTSMIVERTPENEMKILSFQMN